MSPYEAMLLVPPNPTAQYLSLTQSVRVPVQALRTTSLEQYQLLRSRFLDREIFAANLQALLNALAAVMKSQVDNEPPESEIGESQEQ